VRCRRAPVVVDELISRKRITHSPKPVRVRSPSVANTTAAVMRMAFTGSLSATLLPRSTTGMLASIMPSVVPITTGEKCSNRAAGPTVAICVLSPISATKKATSVEINALSD
jgi:hypothetical protein